MSDESTSEIRQFGTRIPGLEYVSRPSAYVVLRNTEGRVAAVRTRVGVFLPGGGQYAGEPPDRAALRELAEECGLRGELLGVIGVADQLVFSEAEATWFEKRSSFFRAWVVGSVGSTEPDRELLWLSPEEAEARLSHDSHRWAVAEGFRGA